MKSITLTKEDREANNYSESEGFILMVLYNLKNGQTTADLKEVILHLTDDNQDEMEEALGSLRSEGYVVYKDCKWFITEDGKRELERIAVFGELREVTQ